MLGLGRALVMYMCISCICGGVGFDWLETRRKSLYIATLPNVKARRFASSRSVLMNRVELCLRLLLATGFLTFHYFNLGGPLGKISGRTRIRKEWFSRIMRRLCYTWPLSDKS